MIQYICMLCHKKVNDNGPYELSNGEYCCQDCMESNQESAKLQYENYLENQQDT